MFFLETKQTNDKKALYTVKGGLRISLESADFESAGELLTSFVKSILALPAEIAGENAQITLKKAELAPEVEENAEPEKQERVYGDPDPVEPVKEEVDIDLFSKIDLRVCKIVKAAEIRKSHSCLKLTLDDGIGERVIVSSIKGEYKPEELVGKKIIVVANLKPARFAGVTSNGMLLAGTNNACGCKVVFVDDMVPTGTQIK